MSAAFLKAVYLMDKCLKRLIGETMHFTIKALTCMGTVVIVNPQGFDGVMPTLKLIIIFFITPVPNFEFFRWSTRFF